MQMSLFLKYALLEAPRIKGSALKRALLKFRVFYPFSNPFIENILYPLQSKVSRFWPNFAIFVYFLVFAIKLRYTEDGIHPMTGNPFLGPVSYDASGENHHRAKLI